MPNIAAGSSVTVTLTRGSTLKTSGAGVAVRGATQISVQNAGSIGPFEADQNILLNATSAMSYSIFQVAGRTVVSSSAPTDADGMPDGTIYIQTAA